MFPSTAFVNKPTRTPVFGQAGWPPQQATSNPFAPPHSQSAPLFGSAAPAPAGGCFPATQVTPSACTGFGNSMSTFGVQPKTSVPWPNTVPFNTNPATPSPFSQSAPAPSVPMNAGAGLGGGQASPFTSAPNSQVWTPYKVMPADTARSAHTSPANSLATLPANSTRSAQAPPAFTFPAQPTFSALAAPAPKLVVEGVTACLSPDPAGLAARKAQAPLFVGAVLRDAYRFMTNPDAPSTQPTTRAPPPATPTAPARHFGAALLGKASACGGVASSLDTFAFVDRAALSADGAPLPGGYRVLDDATLLSALDHLGVPEPLPLAVTNAFELYLARKAAAWTEVDVRAFSMEFLVAFGRELTPRLDAHHRVRSCKLTPEELRRLSTPPFNVGVDARVLYRYQQDSVAAEDDASTPVQQARPALTLTTPPPTACVAAAPEQSSDPSSLSFICAPASSSSAPATEMKSTFSQFFSKAA